jgi:hypothetical protein
MCLSNLSILVMVAFAVSPFSSAEDAGQLPSPGCRAGIEGVF